MYFVHPQLKTKDFFRAFSAFFKSPSRKKLAESLSPFFSERQLVFTDMGRSAFKLAVEKMELRGSELLLPAYICDIFRPVLERYDIKPVFLDIDLQTFHAKKEEIEKKASPKSKAVLVCHTFGLPFDIDWIKNSPNREVSKLSVIEDCAHSFGAGTGDKGEAAFFSLYKQFPTLRGGMLACSKDWEVSLPGTRFNFRDFLSFLNNFPLFAFLFKKFGSKAATRMVRAEKLPKPASVNRVSLNLFIEFLPGFEKALEKRKKLALYFQEKLKEMGFEVQEAEGNVFCYLSCLVPKRLEEKREELVKKLQKQGVFCTRIWHTPVVLDKKVREEYGIDIKDFPNTLEVSKRIVNFPLQNHYTEKDIEKMANTVKEVLKSL